MIQAKLVFYGNFVEILAKALEPDNLPEMRLQFAKDYISLDFCADKIGTLLSTTDDFLMNLKIAEEMLLSGEDG
jgi:hypothetical protein